MIPGIIVINPEMTQQDLLSLKTQLDLSEIITGEEFDDRVTVDPTYHRQVYMLGRRVLVIRQDIYSCDRKNVDFILDLRNGLVSVNYVRRSESDPYAQRVDGYDGYRAEHGCWHEPGLHFKPERDVRPHVLIEEGPRENPFIDHIPEGAPPFGPFHREMIEQWDWDHHIVRTYPWQSAWQGGSALSPFGQAGIMTPDHHHAGPTFPLERLTMGTLYYHQKMALNGNIGPPSGSAAQFHDPFIPWWKKGPLP
jgi:hypothetical protein